MRCSCPGGSRGAMLFIVGRETGFPPCSTVAGGPVTPLAFRAVVAGTLVAALVLAVLVTAHLLSPTPSGPETTSTPGATQAASATPVISRTSPPPVFGTMEIAGVGNVARGHTSAGTAALRFLKTNPAAIPSASGSFRVTLTDSSGQPTITFDGAPSVVAPDSLGASAVLVSGNVLEIRISGSDPVNAELMTITGLSIKASATAALGPIRAVVGSFSGSLAAGVGATDLPSPGTVVATG